MIALSLLGEKINSIHTFSTYYKGLFSIVTGELIVSCPEEVSRQMLESEASLLESVERETECEAVTEREDTYEVIIDMDGDLKSEQYSIGRYIIIKCIIQDYYAR